MHSHQETMSPDNMEQLADDILTPTADAQLTQLRLVFFKPLQVVRLHNCGLKKSASHVRCLYHCQRFSPRRKDN
jgi:hypothetical protein